MDNRLRHLAGLRYFEAAARKKSYSKAAEELFVSQAAVSQKIRQLEQELDCKLFVRQGRDMQLTPSGQMLFQQVSLGFNEIIKGLNHIQSEPIDGLLKVSAPPSFASRWLLPRLWKFSMQYPNIPIQVDTTCKEIRLNNGEMDVAIWQSDTMEPKGGLNIEFLFSEPLYPFCSPLLADSLKFTRPEQLLECWLIHFKCESFSWQDWFTQSGISMNKESVKWMEVETFDLAMSAVMAGHGACLATDSLANDFTQRGMLVKPFDLAIQPGISFHLLTEPSSPRQVRIKAFTQWLKTEIDCHQETLLSKES